MNLKQPFFDRLDEFVPRFLLLYRQRLEKVKELQPFVESLDDDVSNSFLAEGLLSVLFRPRSSHI